MGFVSGGVCADTRRTIPRSTKQKRRCIYYFIVRAAHLVEGQMQEADGESMKGTLSTRLLRAIGESREEDNRTIRQSDNQGLHFA
jgi:hypothetical protein